MKERALRIARPLGLGAALGVAVAWLPADLPGALAVLAVFAAPAWLWLATRPAASPLRALLPVYGAAVGVRVLLALVAHYGLPSATFALDQQRYHRVGWQLAEAWSSGGQVTGPLADEGGYFVWNALLYSLVGDVPLAPALANAAAAGLSVILLHQIARELAGPRAARLAALLLAFFPSLVLWSSLNLKDAFAMLAILAALRGAQRLQTRVSPLAAVLLVAGAAGIGELRPYLLPLVAASAVAGVALPRLARASLPLTLAVWAALCTAIALFPGAFEGIADEASLETLEQHRRNLALGASAYHGGADLSTPGAALRFLPTGVAYFLLAPAPWQLWNARQWLTLPEMLVWYALLIPVVWGLRDLARRRVAAALPVVTFCLLATVAYSLVEANVGTAYRHRAQVLMLYLAFAAVGLASQRARSAACEEANPGPETTATAGAVA